MRHSCNNNWKKYFIIHLSSWESSCGQAAPLKCHVFGEPGSEPPPVVQSLLKRSLKLTRLQEVLNASQAAIGYSVRLSITRH